MSSIDMFFFKQKTAYEMRISDWSSDVCSSDLRIVLVQRGLRLHPQARERRADLVRGLGDERLHRAHVGAQPLHEAVQAVDQKLDLVRCGHRHRMQISRAT